MDSRSLGRLKLWHLVLAVFVTALIFGLFRLLVTDREVLELVLGFVSLLISLIPGVTGVHLGIRFAENVTRGWKERGRLRGGLAGSGLVWFGHAVHGMIYLEGIALGLVFFILTIIVILCLSVFVSYELHEFRIWLVIEIMRS